MQNKTPRNFKLASNVNVRKFVCVCVCFFVIVIVCGERAFFHSGPKVEIEHSHTQVMRRIVYTGALNNEM
jgi:hypothetical protein